MTKDECQRLANIAEKMLNDGMQEFESGFTKQVEKGFLLSSSEYEFMKPFLWFNRSITYTMGQVDIAMEGSALIVVEQIGDDRIYVIPHDVPYYVALFVELINSILAMPKTAYKHYREPKELNNEV